MRVVGPPRIQMAVAAWACLGLAGCSGGSSVDQSAELVSSDSAGVVLVSFENDRLPPPVQLDAEPEWILGDGADSDLGLDLELFRVVDVAQFPDGRIAIAEGSTQQILVVDIALRTVERLGGDGDGPLEFRSLSRLFISSDGILSAYDSRRNRLLTFHMSADSISERALAQVAAPGIVPRLDIDGVGTIYKSVVPGLLGGQGVGRPPGAVVMIGEGVDTLAIVAGLEAFRSAMGAGAVIFGNTTWTAADGGQGVWIGDTAEEEVRLWRGRGDLGRVVRWVPTPREVSEGDIRSFFRTMDDAAPPGTPPPSSTLRDVLPFAERWPAFGRLLAAEGGDLWISQAVDPAVDLLGEGEPPPEEWTVVRFGEEMAERVVTPSGFRVMEIRGEHLLGVHRDEHGIETVRLYRWRAGGGREASSRPDLQE